eukprot:GILK01014761.1.p1 GENE.GILK01014761.1~~GILK01014761.1.p1  ORF type:complete len:950 (-),score=147.95 GILK01014761.1:350-2854(-)
MDAREDLAKSPSPAAPNHDVQQEVQSFGPALQALRRLRDERITLLERIEELENELAEERVAHDDEVQSQEEILEALSARLDEVCAERDRELARRETAFKQYTEQRKQLEESQRNGYALNDKLTAQIGISRQLAEDVGKLKLKIELLENGSQRKKIEVGEIGTKPADMISNEMLMSRIEGLMENIRSLTEQNYDLMMELEDPSYSRKLHEDLDALRRENRKLKKTLEHYKVPVLLPHEEKEEGAMGNVKAKAAPTMVDLMTGISIGTNTDPSWEHHALKPHAHREGLSLSMSNTAAESITTRGSVTADLLDKDATIAALFEEVEKLNAALAAAQGQPSSPFASPSKVGMSSGVASPSPSTYEAFADEDGTHEPTLKSQADRIRQLEAEIKYLQKKAKYAVGKTSEPTTPRTPRRASQAQAAAQLATAEALVQQHEGRIAELEVQLAEYEAAIANTREAKKAKLLKEQLAKPDTALRNELVKAQERSTKLEEELQAAKDNLEITRGEREEWELKCLEMAEERDKMRAAMATGATLPTSSSSSTSEEITKAKQEYAAAKAQHDAELARYESAFADQQAKFDEEVAERDAQLAEVKEEIHRLISELDITNKEREELEQEQREQAMGVESPETAESKKALRETIHLMEDKLSVVTAQRDDALKRVAVLERALTKEGGGLSSSTNAAAAARVGVAADGTNPSTEDQLLAARAELVSQLTRIDRLERAVLKLKAREEMALDELEETRNMVAPLEQDSKKHISVISMMQQRNMHLNQLLTAEINRNASLIGAGYGAGMSLEDRVALNNGNIARPEALGGAEQQEEASFQPDNTTASRYDEEY